MQNLPIALVGLLLADHDQFRPVLGKLNFVRAEPGDGHGYPVVIVAGLLDIIGRPVRAHAVVEHIKETVKADRGAIKGA